MLKRHSRFFKNLFLFFDVLIVSVCWFLAYFLWFQQAVIPIPGEIIPSFKEHLILWLPVVGIYTAAFFVLGLYEPKRTESFLNEFEDLFKASFIAIVVVIFVFHLLEEQRYAGWFPIFFWVTTVLAIFILRFFLREGLRVLRRKGYNLRHILIVGTGKLAVETAKRIHQHREFGLEIVGFLSRNPEETGRVIDGIKVIGSYRDIRARISETKADQVIFALSQQEYRILMVLLGQVDDTMADIHIIPDIRYNFFTLYHGVEDFDGLPVIRLRGSPLEDYNKIMKRCFDFGIALMALIVCSPLMLLVGLLIKRESRGPVFYRQDRMGLDGNLFQMIKFRSMRVDAEVQTGPVWAKEDDPRRTKIGQFLRRTSLDELPQLFNVLKGDMSLVGPRPERPVFIENFRKKIPSYMLRHKIKAGMTGWAQIHGLRGNTSLEKRIEYDIYYIEKWSIGLDIKILLRTIPALLKGEGAY